VESRCDGNLSHMTTDHCNKRSALGVIGKAVLISKKQASMVKIKRLADYIAGRALSQTLGSRKSSLLVDGAYADINHGHANGEK